MGKNLEAYFSELRTPKEHPGGNELESEPFAALNFTASVIANADMVEDLRLANEFALVAWEDEVAREVHPPLRKLQECKEGSDYPSCKPCTAWELDGEQACMTLM